MLILLNFNILLTFILLIFMFQNIFYSYVLLLYIFMKKTSLQLRFILILMLYKEYSFVSIKIINKTNFFTKFLTRN